MRVKKGYKKGHVTVFFVSIRCVTLRAKTSGCQSCALQDSETYAHFIKECLQGSNNATVYSNAHQRAKKPKED